jgi:hypothetical protein
MVGNKTDRFCSSGKEPQEQRAALATCQLFMSCKVCLDFATWSELTFLYPLSFL